MDRDKLRLSMPGFPDVIELRSVSGLWISEDGEPVDVEGLMAAETGTANPYLAQPASTGMMFSVKVAAAGRPV
jgi:hypothetical protein